MTRALALLIALFAFATSAHAACFGPGCPEQPTTFMSGGGSTIVTNNLFAGPTDSWVLVQDGETVQWAIVFRDGRGVGRLDLLRSSVGNVFFIARRPCTNGNLAWGRFQPGALGNDMGSDCRGEFPYPPVVASWREYLESLPPKAKSLLE